ncbi:unnamed protein product, partial [Lampetra planeri]
LRRLISELPDDLLEYDSSSELEYHTCRNNTTGNSPPWTQQWSDHPGTTSHEQNTDKQRFAEAAVDNVQQQMLCCSDMPSPAQQQYDRDLAAMKEQHAALLLVVEEKLDSNSQARREQLEQLHLTGESQEEELQKLREVKVHLQEQVKVLEKKIVQQKKTEEKLRMSNQELCTQMREMIQTQEAAAQTQLTQANDKSMALQECYISVCKEKDMLEKKMKEDSVTALEKLRSDLEAEHQASVTQLKALWSKEMEAEIQRVKSAQVACNEERQQALNAAEQWYKHQKQLEESEAQGLEALRERVVCLQSQLEQARREHAALLKAELARAKVAWNRDKQREISSIHLCNEQIYQAKLHHEQKKLEEAVSWVREDAEGQKKELLLQAKVKQKISEEKFTHVLMETQKRHKRTMSMMEDEHKRSLQKEKDEHLQQLEEMRHRHLVTLEKMRGDMLRFLQESWERATEMICMEVHQGRQGTARKAVPAMGPVCRSCWRTGGR